MRLLQKTVAASCFIKYSKYFMYDWLRLRENQSPVIQIGTVDVYFSIYWSPRPTHTRPVVITIFTRGVRPSVHFS